MVSYVNQHREYFSRLDIDTYHAVQAFLNSETKIKRVLKDESGKERIADLVEMPYEKVRGIVEGF